MKRITTGIILTVLALIAMAAPKLATAQTTQYLLGTKACPSFNSTYYCDGIPITNMDGSWPSPNNSENGTAPYVWTDLMYNGRANWFDMLTNGGLGILEVSTIKDVLDPSGSGVHDVDVTFTDPTVTLHFAYTLGTRHCSGGRGGGCSTPWTILSGAVYHNATFVKPLNYWCPGESDAAVGLFFPAGGGNPVPFRYCENWYGSDTNFLEISWGDYWDWRQVLGY